MKAVKIVDNKPEPFVVDDKYVTYTDKDGVGYAVLVGWNWVIKDNRTMQWGWTIHDAVPELYVFLKGVFTFVCKMHHYEGDLEDELSMRLISAGAPTLHEFLKAKVEAEGKEER